MGMICPRCLGTLTSSDGRTAQCPNHEGAYTILFARDVAPAAEGVPATPAGAAAVPAAGDRWLTVQCTCGKTLRVPAGLGGKKGRCGVCGTLLDIPLDQAALPRPAPAPAAQGWATGPVGVPQVQPAAQLPAADELSLAPAVEPRPLRTGFGLAGVMCKSHPEVQAVHRCKVCRAGVCPTCDFSFPGGVHLCPACASKPPEVLGPKRKKLLVWAYGLAVWCTLGLVGMFAWGAASGPTAPGDAEAVGMAFGFFVFVPTIIGAAVSVGALEKRLGNPPVVWGSVIWNGLLLAILLLLTIVGHMSG